MNERVYELANKANEVVGYKPGREDLKALNELVVKIAELLINDVLEIMYEESTPNFSLENKIKQHFGVKE